MFRNIGKKEDYVEMTRSNDGLYKIEWDYRPIRVTIYESEDSDSSEIIETIDDTFASWEQEVFTRKPDISEIKEIILSYYDDKTNKKIVNDFKWIGRNGEVVNPKLTLDNQSIFKNIFDSNGSRFPFIVEYDGGESEPSYYEFTEVDEFLNFYSSCLNHIDTCNQEGQIEKESIDWSLYQIK